MISIANINHSREIAEIHKKTIVDGFLSKLGINFLSILYEFLIKNELVLVYLENNKVVGFVSCALNSAGIIKKFIFSKPKAIFILLKKIIFNPLLILPVFETSKSTSSSTNDFYDNILPKTELLSISVLPLTQHKGIGTLLLKNLENQLLQKKISIYKVIAGDNLKNANLFYLKNGFELKNKIQIHKDETSNVYIKQI